MIIPYDRLPLWWYAARIAFIMHAIIVPLSHLLTVLFQVRLSLTDWLPATLQLGRFRISIFSKVARCSESSVLLTRNGYSI
jgi:hypothetical protein